ncbi:MAG TPA: PTS sugar transporter subunit IIA [Thermaerobacter sp.]
MISEWLPAEAIGLDVEATSWEDAVREAGRLLVATGAASPAYAEAMVETVKALGPYIVIAPGIAMPHARPEAGALRAGLSFVRLRRPVTFGHEANDPVDLIFGMAATASDAHVEMMAALAEALSDPGRLARLRAAGTPQEVRDILDGKGGHDAVPAPSRA